MTLCISVNHLEKEKKKEKGNADRDNPGLWSLVGGLMFKYFCMWDPMCHIWLGSSTVVSVYVCKCCHSGVRQFICIMREPQAVQVKGKI